MSLKKKLSMTGMAAIFIIIGWFLLSFVIVPVFGVVKEIFFTDGNFSMHSIKKLVSSGRVKSALTNSYLMAFCTVITVSLVATFQILATEYFKLKGSKFMELIFMTPLMYGGISLVTGYNYVYSANGFITKALLEIFPGMNPYWFTGFSGVLFVHTFSMTTFHILFVKTAFKRIDYSTIEACKSLGANDMQAFFKVALPVIKPSIFSATILLVLGALNSFAAPSILGGKNFYMINSMILNLNGLRSYDLSALLSFILALTCIALLLIMKWFEKRSSYISVSKVPAKIKKIKIRNPVVNIMVHAAAYFMTLIYLLPIAGIILFSLGDLPSITTSTFPKSFSPDNYIRVFSNPVTLQPFLNSVKLSLLAVLIVMFISVASSLAIHRKPGKVTSILEMTLLIPWMLPATMLVVGMITTYSRKSILMFNQVLLGGFWLLPVAYAVCQLPSAMRLIRASLYSVNNSHEEAARSLGAGVFYTFRRVVFPAILPTAVSVGAICFNGLLSEYTVSALLYNINNIPLGIVLRQPAISADLNSEANTLVYIVVLMIISGITLMLTQKYRNND